MKTVRVEDRCVKGDWIEFRSGFTPTTLVIETSERGDAPSSTVCLDLAGAEQAARALIEFIRNHPDTQAAQAKAAAEYDADDSAAFSGPGWPR